ncbi:MAG: hypothetical protein KME45_32155 [Stenomitos rutilans HA7619-LM2]|jgi:hypothetical protein|nr:hypothetical protein [Stenomitos rutilans HA7619-LM2]
MKVKNLRESPLVQSATEARRHTYWWLAAILIFVVGVIGVGSVVGKLYGMLIPNKPGSFAAQGMEFFTNGAALLALWLWLRFREQRSFASVGFRGGGALPKFGIGLVIGTGMIILTMLILSVTGQYQIVPAPPNTLSGTAALLPVLALVIRLPA